MNEVLSFEEKLKYYHMEEYFHFEICETCDQLSDMYNHSSKEEKGDMELKLMKNISTYTDFSAKMYMSSFMYELTKNDYWFDMMLDALSTVDKNYFSWEIMFQIRGQLVAKMFVNPSLQTTHRKVVISRIYKNIIEEMKENIGLKLQRIPVEERNQDLVVVMTCQFLSIEHGPTKTALDRCSTLIRKENKKVILINSGELLNIKNKLPVYSYRKGTYDDKLLELDFVEYQGITIPYYQCMHDMPNREGIIEVLNMIDELRPLYIIHIGGESPLCEYCNDIVPAISIGTVPSEVGCSMMELQVMGRALQERDMAIVEALGKTERNVIAGRFTSSVPMSKMPTSRKELGLPEDKFLCVVVGARLNYEVTDDFVKMMRSVSDKVNFVFAGVFDDMYDYYSKEYVDFVDIAINLGFSNNMMGVYSVCDLYVNPIRQGGGTSVIEAMYEGLPAVTLNYGDVSLGCGEEFFVTDYNDMVKVIDRYTTDTEFYTEKSKRARDRAEEMLDSDTLFCEILRKIEERIL